MINTIQDLEPKLLWKHFNQICAIPHPSKNEAQLVEYVRQVARRHNIEVESDDVGNLLLRKKATPSMENCRGVVLQAHLDMVPQKNNDTKHDFNKDPIQPYIDGDWVKAKGTTLGADNGVGVAAALAIMESSDLVHGPLEALLTIDEEAGMTGAFGLKRDWLRSDILLNLDSEDEGEFCIGCAGGIDTSIRFCYEDQAVPAAMSAFQVTLNGLKGGHSGVDIQLGRGNSNKILCRFLYDANRRFDLFISHFEGGSLRNAIPRESYATLVVNNDHRDDFLCFSTEFSAMMQAELGAVETSMAFDVKPIALPQRVLSKNSGDRLLTAVYAAVNDVIRMDPVMANTVETSSNMGIVTTGNGCIEVFTLQRSSRETAKLHAAQRLAAPFRLIGAEVKHGGGYPGWQPNIDSTILKTMQNIYFEYFGQEAKVSVTHGGLECGLIGAAYPNLEMISFGPTIRNPHSPDEKLHIASVEKFWNLLTEVLRKTPQKRT